MAVWPAMAPSPVPPSSACLPLTSPRGHHLSSVCAWSGRLQPFRPEESDAAASYVDARINGITEDLAACQPGGRNTAIYTAALKVGSTLGAARSTPGAEQAAAAWSDEGAEDALMAAAGQNGYIADHSAVA